MKIGNCSGSEFSRTQTVNSTDTEAFYPYGLRPWDGEWEEPTSAHARFAHVSRCREKAAGLRPLQQAGAGMSVGRNGLDEISTTCH